MNKFLRALSFTLLLTVALSCAALPAPAEEQPDSVVGCWEMYAIRQGETMVTNLQERGFRQTLILWPNGMGHKTLVNNETTAQYSTWSRSGDQIIFNPDAPSVFQVSGDELVLTINDQTQFFHKVYWPMDTHPVPAAGTKEEFTGAWAMCAIDATAFGLPGIVPDAVFALQYVLTVSEDTALLFTKERSSDKLQMSSFTAAFEDGLMYLTPTNSTDPTSRALVTKHENGWISLGMNFSGDIATLYFAPVSIESPAPSEEPEKTEAPAAPSGFTFAPAK